MESRNRRRLAELLLGTVTVFWGATFPIVKEAVEQVPVLCFLWIRFAVGALLLAAFAGRRLGSLDSGGVGRGVLLGVLLFLAYAFQTYGLERTSAANAGFLTGLNVVWVPLLAGPLLGKPPGRGSCLGVALAVPGLFLLTWQSPWQLELGDALVVGCSVFIALHILGLDAVTAGHDARALAFVQIATMATLSGLASLAFEPVTWPRGWSEPLVTAVATTAVFATAYAFWVQTSFQRWTTPTRAALIYLLEPVFASVFSVWLIGEHLSGFSWLGGSFILLGMGAAELWPGPSPPLSAPHPEDGS